MVDSVLGFICSHPIIQIYPNAIDSSAYSAMGNHVNHYSAPIRFRWFVVREVIFIKICTEQSLELVPEGLRLTIGRTIGNELRFK